MSRTRISWLGALALAACVHSGPNPRTLHYMGKDLVATPAADYRAYGAYAQAQLALGSDPPDLPRALAASLQQQPSGAPQVVQRRP